MKILLVEDDLPTGSALAKALIDQRYSVDAATNGKDALNFAQTVEYDLILLDILIPEIDGISVCRTLRSQGNTTPILLLTAKDTSSDRIIGLDAGADDYMVKPYNLLELMARIRALLRRGRALQNSVLTWEKLSCDISTHEVSYDEKLLKLTPKEYGIVELFLLNPRRIFSRSLILDRLWEVGESPGEDTVTTHIKGLRQKLKSAGAGKDFIETVYGLGYRLKPPVETAQSTEPEAPVDLMQGMWERFKGDFMEQVAHVEAAAIALQAATLTPELLQQAKQDAHKLAGGLGIFGFPNGSKIAKEIENLLQSQETLSVETLIPLVESLKQELKEAPNHTTTHPVANSQSTVVLMIDDDRTLAESLQAAAKVWNIQMEVALDLTCARQALKHRSPHAVLLDLDFSNSADDGLTFLQEMTQSDLPVLVFTGRNSLSDRIEVARLGGRAFLHKPIAPEEVFERILQITNQARSPEGNLLIVDDDPKILAMLYELLEPWGLHLTTLDNSQYFWETLESCAPDLLILDIEMPTFSGIELCQAVRHDLRWGDLPVLFLTAHTEEDTIHQAFAVGADDYIRKPIIPPELITRIMNRLDRIRLKRKLATPKPYENAR
jgi:DNA-binding response OmpR family regulator